MRTTIDSLQKGQRAVIREFDIEVIPLKLLEMGCLPGNEVQLLQVAPLGDPLYLEMNGAHLAIRLETAKAIEIDLIPAAE